MWFHIQKGWGWFVERAESTHTKWWLALLSFTEASVFVIPPDPLLAAIILAGSQRWLYWALFTTVISIVGGIAGYILGAFFFDAFGVSFISFYGLQTEFEDLKVYVAEGAFGIILLGALTPLPYKIVVLASGFLKVNFFVFLLASIVGRGLRYGIVSYGTYILRDDALRIAKKYSVHITIASIVVFAIYVLYIIFSV